jgi:hypothetical protein
MAASSAPGPAPVLAGLAAAAAAGWLVYRMRALRGRLRERQAAFRALTDALERRHTHTLELVRLASGYLVLEAPLLEAVALARYYAMQARTVLARTRTETDLSWALARLMLAAEARPELAGHPQFRGLARAVMQAEDEAAAARTAFNDRTAALARSCGGALGRWLCHLMHAGAREPFDLDPTVAREAMMTLLKPRPTPDAVAAAGSGTAAPGPKPVRSVASVAFGT